MLAGSEQLVDCATPERSREKCEPAAAQIIATVREMAEEKPACYPRVPQIIPLKKLRRVSLPSRKNNLEEHIEVAKNLTSYRAHSYHTKVPPEAIIPFIRAFTHPGDTVFDPFCGSGMTGVAALMEGRNAILSDLSPAAVHISRNYTSPCDPEAFLSALARVEKLVKPTIEWLYRPGGCERMVEYTTWSDIYRCPACQECICYWDVVQRSGGKPGDSVDCLACGARSRKADLQWVAEKPVVSHTSSQANRIESHEPAPEELALVADASSAAIPYWFPQVPFGAEREMWRSAHRAMGITDVSQFFTRRNLHALAALRHAIISTSEARVREALLFAFTACVNRASRRYQWNAKRPTNVMTGTLYISSLRYEWNVWSLFRRKAADVLRYYQNFPMTAGRAQVFQRSATDLDCLPDRSVDMVFMDPPFGSNIFYADSSLLWEAWLGALTDDTAEIVVNRHRSAEIGGKTVEQYSALLTDAFGHVARVLRPGGRAVLAFSNSDDRIWDSVQRAFSAVGFAPVSVHVLDKGQPSIKGVKGLAGKESVTCLDLLMCLEHRNKNFQLGILFPPPPGFVDQIIRETCATRALRTDELYSAVIRALVQSNYSVSGITMPIIATRCREMGGYENEGKWRLKECAQQPTSESDPS